MNTPEQIRALVDAGMDVARMNLSHGSYDDHERVYRMVREAADATGHGVGIFADLQGPKIRLGKVAGSRPRFTSWNDPDRGRGDWSVAR